MLDKKYLYIKEFKYTNTGNLILMNPQMLLEYISEKVGKLLETHSNSEEQLHVKREIINDFFEMYEFDCKNAIVPEPFGYFSNPKLEKEKIRKTDLMFDLFYGIFGNIYSNYHEEIIKNELPIKLVYTQSSIINYNELYRIALNEYYRVFLKIDYPDILNLKKFYQEDKAVEIKIANQMSELGVPIGETEEIKNKEIIPKKDEHAYVSSYIFPALIEDTLGLHVRSRLFYTAMTKLGELKEKQNIVFEEDEERLYKIFCKGGYKRVAGNEKKTLKKLYNMFIKYNALEENSDYEMIIVGEAIENNKNKSKKIMRTIGGIIHSSYANQVVFPEYIKLLDLMFSSDKLNIRNNIMHGVNQNYDYFAIGFTSVMLQILWDIGENVIFVD